MLLLLKENTEIDRVFILLSSFVVIGNFVA